MTSLEDLKSRLEALEFEKQHLEVDNLRLRTEQHDSLRELERYKNQLSPGHEGNEMEALQSDYQLLEMELSLARATLDEQGDQHKEDQEHISELTAELFEKTELELRCQELKEHLEELTGELERRELERFRAVEREKTRWEKREECIRSNCCVRLAGRRLPHLGCERVRQCRPIEGHLLQPRKCRVGGKMTPQWVAVSLHLM